MNRRRRWKAKARRRWVRRWREGVLQNWPRLPAQTVVTPIAAADTIGFLASRRRRT